MKNHTCEFDDYNFCFICNTQKDSISDRCVACGVSVCGGNCGLPILDEDELLFNTSNYICWGDNAGIVSLNGYY